MTDPTAPPEKNEKPESPIDRLWKIRLSLFEGIQKQASFWDHVAQDDAIRAVRSYGTDRHDKDMQDARRTLAKVDAASQFQSSVTGLINGHWQSIQELMREVAKK
ncbi:hypothetical protein [Planctomicrobium piriforme]|uniref:Uncharacterized protein n=1 Tax=Planctomicrobium piriforme TaxID=1576369 RepID=A0A1I3EGF5_9PLAN|nr:hypothetical protein [Planctomicrobium piriforme]SFH98034.1 hypothetical protein SAMN05421753_104211 [Planctomicrobium piriforme]